jgi:hypothetical protein
MEGHKSVVSFIVLHFVCLGLSMVFPDFALKLPQVLFDFVPKGTPG